MNKDKNNNIITIDGPAGSGKSTIAKIIARDLGLKYIDTGAMYRAMTLIALKNDIDLEDEESILARAKKIKLNIDSTVSDENNYTKLRLDDIDVTDEIRSREVGAAVSIVSKLSGIRKYLVSIQRKLAGEGNAVLEGRDTGSIVCPDALLKIFLTASIGERVKRRKLQLDEKNQKMEVSSIEEEIKNRDRIDSSRENSPLMIPEDGIEIDTSDMTIVEVINKIKQLYYGRTKT
ncbi:MAG TPA: (d)CMP kinase [Actinobacteria bacterium]|nr:(d)CMP kinase [Actinomycetota bacterium]